MQHGSETHRSLGQEVLRLYTQAVAEQRWAVAEFLMCALEDLAKSDPACEAAVEQAYLCIGCRNPSFDA